MNAVFNLRLPHELCDKVQKEAKMNKLSINQFILYTLTKTISYNEAYEKFTSIFKNVNSESYKDILKKIPKKKPLYDDELN